MQSRKQKVIAELFEICKSKNDFVFHNDLVKIVCKKHKFGNPFDVTKVDNSNILPDILKDEDYFIIHLGKGMHKFIKGVGEGYHKFEKIKEKNIYDWKYRKSLLNEFDTSESNILSVASNQRIIHDFLYEDIVASPKVYGSRRTKIDMDYNLEKEVIKMTKLQMEIDMTFELNNVVTVFEGKNNFPDDFAIYQLFHPFKYYTILKNKNELPVNKITCCYVLRKIEKDMSILRLYNYTFENENSMSSIKLLKSAQYNLIKR